MFEVWLVFQDELSVNCKYQMQLLSHMSGHCVVGLHTNFELTTHSIFGVVHLFHNSYLVADDGVSAVLIADIE